MLKRKLREKRFADSMLDEFVGYLVEEHKAKGMVLNHEGTAFIEKEVKKNEKK